LSDKSASFGVNEQGRLFSYNILALCRIGKAGKRKAGDKVETRIESEPQNDKAKQGPLIFYTDKGIEFVPKEFLESGNYVILGK